MIFTCYNPEALQILCRDLEHLGLSTERAQSGPQAIELLRSRPPFALLVCDWKMPGMDGIETLRHIKQMKPEIEVIMLTGHASVEFGLKGMQLGAFDYVMKPAPLNELLDTINQAWSKKRGLH